MVPRDKTNYVVSFIGFAPADDPQIVVYFVNDRPNVADQPHASYATAIVKNVLTEVLPYMHIGRTEEMTITEQEEADNLLGNIIAEENKDNEDDGENGDGENGDAEDGDKKDDEGQENGDAENGGSDEDAGTGKPRYIVDPDTGELIDSETGEKAELNYNYDGGSAEAQSDAGAPEGDGSAE